MNPGMVAASHRPVQGGSSQARSASVAVIIFGNLAVAVVEAGRIHGDLKRSIARDATIAPLRQPLQLLAQGRQLQGAS